MKSKFKIALLLASLAAVAALIYDFWLWQPERQVGLHHVNFLRAAEDRRWARFADFIDPQYRDRWGHDRAFVIRESSEVLRQFFSLTIESEALAVSVAARHGTTSARLKISGNGTALAEMVKPEINCLPTPFVFEWTRESWRPWDWKLTRADNAQLRFEGRSFLDE